MKPYSRHTLGELEAERTAAYAPAIAAFHRLRIEQSLKDVSTRLDNVRYRLAEISDCMDDAVGDAGLRVEFRPLLETLRVIEVELEAAVGRLAGELGLVAL